MYKKHLTALEHPTPNAVDFTSRKDFASLVVWLEDLKIRNLPIEARGPLRKTDNLRAWENEFSKYKNSLEMPAFTKPGEDMAWLLSHAVRLEYLDEPDKYKDTNSSSVNSKAKTNAPNIKSKNIFDNLDTQNADFKQGVRTLANQLGLVHHPDSEVLLEAAAVLINKNKDTFAGKKNTVSGTPFISFEEKYIVSNDKNLDLAVRIMRFNQLYKLRDLQTKINEAIAAVQDVTADPRTDTKLGKVGF